ncbi:MAG: hypothetical protein CL908_12625 [Deltaproteobacteria bacterium]|nr:hypothetical protein [Deltaproteobacteria bacterium]
MVKRTWAWGLALASCLAISSLCRAAEPLQVRANVIAEAPIIDGSLDDPSWQQAFVIQDFTQVEPILGGEPSERTLIYVARDEKNLYFGIRCYDDDPSSIVAKRMQRDDFIFYDDRVEIVLDTFHDRRNGYLFAINPVGGRRDAIFEGEIFMPEWDGIWHAEARLDEEGWVAEIAIPFQTLSFDPGTDTWGLNILRGIRRNDERIRWADPTLNRAFFNMSQVGVLEGMQGISQGLGLDIKPYFALGYTDDPLADRSEEITEPGGDIAYKLTPSLTATVTANTDFAETDIDEAQSTVTRFALFFPEKRDFFLQDAGIFEFADLQHGVISPDGDTDANARPFFSRKIGLAADGEEVDILAGGKLTGRIGPLNLGLLDVQLEDRDDVRSKNLAVGRVAMNVLGESKLGAIVTNGDPNSNDKNTLVGTDFNYRNSHFLGSRVLEGRLWYQRSFSEGVGGKERAFGATLAYPNDAVNWFVNYREIEENFNPALGFVNRRGVRRYAGEFRHRIRPGGFLRTVDNMVEGKVFTDSSDEVESWRVRAFPFTLTSEKEDFIQFAYAHDYDSPKSPFPIKDDIYIPAGQYSFDQGAISLRSSRNRPLRANMTVAGGSFYSGETLHVVPGVEWRPTKHLFFSGEYTLTQLWVSAVTRGAGGTFSERREEYVIRHLARVRANISFTPDISLNTFVQWNDAANSMAVNSRLRWIVQDGREFFLVFTQFLDTEDGIERGETQPLAKIGWTFRL